jgi:WD40 repeat protein
MSGFESASGGGGAGDEPGAKVYNIDGEILTEVDVGDDPIPDDESVWSDMPEDNVEEIVDDEDGFNKASSEMLNIEDLSIYTFNGHTRSVHCIALHPVDSSIVITGGEDDKAFIWSWKKDGLRATDIVVLHELSGHRDTVTAVGFNFDGTMALTAAYDGTVRIWDTASGECKQILEGPEEIDWAYWHSKGNAVIAGSTDGTVWMWLAMNGQCLQVFAGHDGGVSAGAFTNDGKFVVSGGDDGTVRVWAPKTGQCKHVFEGHVGHEGTVTCIKSSVDGDLMLTGAIDGKVRLYQISGKRVLLTMNHFTIPDGANDTFDESNMSVESVGFCNTPNMPLVASGGIDGNLRIWDSNTGAMRCENQHKDSIISLQWHETMPIVATACRDRSLRLIDARTGDILLDLTGHRDAVLAFTMKTLAEPVEVDGRLYTDVVVTTSDDHSCKVYYFNTTN